MTGARTLIERQKRLKQALTRHQVTVSADPPDWAEIQAVLARGDRRLAPALLEVDRVSPRSFREALARHGLSMEELLAARDPNAFMPWEIVDTGLRTSFLRRESRLALEGSAGHRCPPGRTRQGTACCPEESSGSTQTPAPGPCLVCGVCDATVWLGDDVRPPCQQRP
jgi:hypothetical protein